MPNKGVQKKSTSIPKKHYPFLNLILLLGASAFMVLGIGIKWMEANQEINDLALSSYACGGVNVVSKNDTGSSKKKLNY